MTAPNVVTKWRSWAPYLLSVLRIIAAFLFMQFGTAKLFAFPAAIMPGGGTAPLASLAGIARDRKSTRLNSSHGYISYAVFCLKKKKKRSTHAHLVAGRDAAVPTSR